MRIAVFELHRNDMPVDLGGVQEYAELDGKHYKSFYLTWVPFAVQEVRGGAGKVRVYARLER